VAESLIVRGVIFAFVINISLFFSINSVPPPFSVRLVLEMQLIFFRNPIFNITKSFEYRSQHTLFSNRNKKYKELSRILQHVWMPVLPASQAQRRIHYKQKLRLFVRYLISWPTLLGLWIGTSNRREHTCFTIILRLICCHCCDEENKYRPYIRPLS